MHDKPTLKHKISREVTRGEDEIAWKLYFRFQEIPNKTIQEAQMES